MTDKQHDTTHRYTLEEVDLFLNLLIDNDNVINDALLILEGMALDENCPDYEQAKSLIDWVNTSKQSPRNRVLYDLRRVHYNRYLELLRDGNGLARINKILVKGEDINAQKAFEFLHNVTKGKPATKVEITSHVSHSEVQTAVEKGVEPLSIDGKWVNPEDFLELDDGQKDSPPTEGETHE